MGIPISYIQVKVSFFGSMQRLARHRTSMLAVIFVVVVLVALSSTIVMLITMGQEEEETSRQQEEEEANLQDDYQLIVSTAAKGKAHFGLGILNRIEHRIIDITNNNNNNNNNAITTATAPANDIMNNNNNNANNDINRNTLSGEENKKNSDHTTAYANQNIFVNSKNSPVTTASCGQLITTDVIVLEDLECAGVGMIAGTDGITINLNNHRLSLANHSNAARIPEVEEIGILITSQKNVTIMGPGVITGFDKAIEFAGSERGYVLDLRLTDNNIGVAIKASNDITIYRNFIERNTIGMASQSSNDTLIISNQVSQNANQGIVLMDSDYFIIGANSLIGNGNIGLFLDVRSFNNTLSSNNILKHAVDVSNADGVPIDISMNEYFENSCGKSLPDGLC
jgi:parallel beta-helix repeat protein